MLGVSPFVRLILLLPFLSVMVMSYPFAVALSDKVGDTPSVPASPLMFANARSKFGVCISPLFVTVTLGVPTWLSTLAVTDISGVVPIVPSSPLSPLSPLSPFSP